MAPPERQFSRVCVSLVARFRVLPDKQAAEALRAKLNEGASVWHPSGESELLRLSSSPSAGSDGVLARTVLDLSRQVTRLSQLLLDEAEPREVGSVQQLSGGGALFATDRSLEIGAMLDVRLADEHMEAPPIRFMARVAHVRGAPPARYGIVFEAINGSDRDALIRYLYQMQRRELREVHYRRSEPSSSG